MHDEAVLAGALRRLPARGLWRRDARVDRGERPRGTQIAPVVAIPRRDSAAGSRSLSENKAAPLAVFPRALSLDAFADGDRIADLTALAVEPQVLLAWVTYVDPGGGPSPKESQKRGGKGSPISARPTMGATVSVRPLDPKLEPMAAPKVISAKADAAGGVSLAPSANGDELALAWVGKDAGVSQVFLTRLSRAGEKQAQKMLTHAKGDCSDVALAKLGTGWVVAWVEQDANSATLYAAKVGRDLQRTSAEQVIARAKGEASQVRLMTRGDDVLLAWNETQGDSFSGVYAARLAADTVSLRSDPVRLAVSPGRVHGLRVAGFGEGLVLAWLEGATLRAKQTKARRRLAASRAVDEDLIRADPRPHRCRRQLVGHQLQRSHLSCDDPGSRPR